MVTSEFIDIFLIKFFARSSENPKELFKNVSLNFPFELLIMFDLFREHAC